VPSTDDSLKDGLLTVEQLDEGPRLRLALHGELDLSNAKKVEAALTEAFASEKQILVDLTQLEFLDSTGIALLVATLQRHDAARLSFLPSESRDVRRLLNLTGLDRRMALSKTGGASPTPSAI